MKSQPASAKRPAAAATPEASASRTESVVSAVGGMPLRSTARQAGRISQKK